MANRHHIRARNVPAPAPAPTEKSVRILSDVASKQFEALLLALRDIESMVIVATGALRAENGWPGICTARLLKIHVSDRLSVEIDRASAAFGVHLKTDEEYEP